jgi:hypothetical protein
VKFSLVTLLGVLSVLAVQLLTATFTSMMINCKQRNEAKQGPNRAKVNTNQCSSAANAFDGQYVAGGNVLTSSAIVMDRPESRFTKASTVEVVSKYSFARQVDPHILLWLEYSWLLAFNVHS